MKICGYCGREDEDAALHCTECATGFAIETPGRFSDVIRWTPRSPIGLGLTTGLGAFFITTGIYFSAGRLMLDMSAIDLTGLYDQFIFLPTPSPLLGIALIGFIVFVSYRRFLRTPIAAIVAIATSLLFSCFAFLPMAFPAFSPLLFLLPTVILGLGTDLSAGYYFGTALQVFVGAWLLGWFRNRKTPNETSVQ